jgi:ABC-2 type transport system permease protein
MLVSVTAEKQLRVTEQVISAIPAQTWIDGKILGISAVALVNVLLFLASGALWILGRSFATGSGFSIGAIEPTAILWIILFAVLGFAFWLSVFGVIAATIDDPNTSTRGPLMFLPAMFSVAGFMIVRNPDSTFARIVGQLPLTSSSVMPARIALTDVPIWEILLSAGLLLGGVMLARRAAGKVFSVAMLMYGKEPSWGEIRRWVREG